METVGEARKNMVNEVPRHPSRHYLGLPLRCRDLEQDGKSRVLHSSGYGSSHCRLQTQTHPSIPRTQPSGSPSQMQAKPNKWLFNRKRDQKSTIVARYGVWSVLGPHPTFRTTGKPQRVLESCVAPCLPAPTCGAVVFANFTTSHR